MNEHVITPVGVIHTDFPEKFGIPRQSLLVPEALGVITFEEKFRSPAAIRGIEEYSHLWLLWGFSKSQWDGATMTVHPPRLGGKVKKGIFATRSPFRPNGIGMSCVRLEEIKYDENGVPSLVVSGIDMLDGTPIYDIKPYIPYSDSIQEAKGSFGQANKDFRIKVDFPKELLEKLPEDKQDAALHLLSQDPRAAYNKAPDHVFGLSYAGYDIRFLAVKDPESENACDKLVVIDVVAIDDSFGKIK